MLYLDRLPCVSGTHLVAGMSEHEERDKYERREKNGHDRQALLVGHIVTGFLHPFPDFPLGPVPHLIIEGRHEVADFLFYTHWDNVRFVVIKSLFSKIVRPSIMKPLGLSSEREVLTSRQLVISDLSVTLL